MLGPTFGSAGGAADAVDGGHAGAVVDRDAAFAEISALQQTVESLTRQVRGFRSYDCWLSMPENVVVPGFALPALALRRIFPLS